jgi:hypothetical protein
MRLPALRGRSSPPRRSARLSSSRRHRCRLAPATPLALTWPGLTAIHGRTFCASLLANGYSISHAISQPSAARDRQGQYAVHRLANLLTICDGNGVFFVAASGQIRMRMAVTHQVQSSRGCVDRGLLAGGWMPTRTGAKSK